VGEIIAELFSVEEYDHEILREKKLKEIGRK
jgi:hypothetical protein